MTNSHKAADEGRISDEEHDVRESMRLLRASGLSPIADRMDALWAEVQSARRQRRIEGWILVALLLSSLLFAWTR